jgi:hypothetical protein
MPDLSLQTLVVQGVDREVAAFRRVSRANRTSRSEGSPLSFRRLMRVLPAGAATDEYLRRGDLFDLVVDPTCKLEHGMAETTYKFQLHRGDLEAFIVEISQIYPQLCFILGTVAPSADQQESCFIHDGQLQSWRLPESQREKLLAAVPEDTDDNQDQVFWELVQSDWAMMDAVVDHWAVTAERKRAEIAASRSASTS